MMPPRSGSTRPKEPAGPTMGVDRFRLLHLRRMWTHRLRTAVSVLGIAAGVALVVAMASFVTSTTATVQATVALLGGARYEITAPTPDIDRVIDDVTALNGVIGVRRFLEAPVLVDGTQVWLVALEDGAGNGSEPPPVTAEAEALVSVDGIRTGSELPADGKLTIVGFGGGPTTAAIAGRLDGAIAERYGGLFLAADFDTARNLQGPTRTETLLVYGNATGGVDAVAAAAGEVAEVHLVDDRVARARNSIQIFLTSAIMVAAMGLTVGGFLLFNTMSMTVLDHRQELASLRALGSTRRAILIGVFLDAALLGTVGSLLGLAFGLAIARGVVASIPDAFVRVIGTPLQVSVPAPVLTAAFVVGVATAVVAAIGPARRAVSVNPTEALRPHAAGDSALAGHRSAIRPVVLAAGIGLTAVAGFIRPGAAPGWLPLGAAMTGLLCLAFGGSSLIAGATVMIARRLGASGALAATALRRDPRRVWGTTTVVIMAVAAAVTVGGTTLNLRASTNNDHVTVLKSDFWIGTTTGDTIALVELPAEWTPAFEAIPGVSAVAASTYLPAEAGAHLVGIQGVYGDSSYAFTRLAGDDARRRMMAGDGAIILRQTAEAFDLQVGDEMDIPGATPPLRLPVVAITDVAAPSGGGMISISHRFLTTHYGIEGFAHYEIQLQPGADPVAVEGQLERITAEAGIPVHTYTGREVLDQLQRASDEMVRLVSVILLIIVACSAIAVLNTLLASILERTNELAALRAIGATKRRVLTSVAYEALAIGVTGASLGAIAGAGYHAVMVRNIQALTSFSIDYAFSSVTFVAAIITGVVIAIVGAAIPGRRAARLDVMQALTN